MCQTTGLSTPPPALDRSGAETDSDIVQTTPQPSADGVGRPAEDIHAPKEAETQINHAIWPSKTAIASTASRATVIDIGVPSDSHTPRLVAMHPSGHPVEYALREGDMTIGRGNKSDIRLSNDFVSRIHAKIRTRKTVTVIEDASSRNGTTVNSVRVQRCVLRDGDVVRIGGAVDRKFIAPVARS